MSASSSNNSATAGGGGGGNIPSGGQQAGSKKTHVCLICGIYTNLSLNIFEPRNGPNIREVIYQKYNFKAERGDNEDKYICYSCNNWLINWYSLQYLSESRNYESTPSSNRSPSENRNKHSKNGRSHSCTASRSRQDKENLEQDDRISSTVETPKKEKYSSNLQPRKPVRRILKESVHPNLISCNSSSNVLKLSECDLIQMLKKQGTSVTKENKPPISTLTPIKQLRTAEADHITKKEHVSKTNDIILSFNSTISEVVNEVPLLKSMCHNGNHQNSLLNTKNNFLVTRKFSRSLSISLINSYSDNDLSQ